MVRPWTPLRQRPWPWWVIQGCGYAHAGIGGWLATERLWGLGGVSALIGLCWFLYSDWRWAWPK